MVSVHFTFIWTLGVHLIEKWSKCAFPISAINHFLASSHNCEKRLMDFLYLLTMEYERALKNMRNVRIPKYEAVLGLTYGVVNKKVIL